MILIDCRPFTIEMDMGNTETMSLGLEHGKNSPCGIGAAAFRCEHGDWRRREPAIARRPLRKN